MREKIDELIWTVLSFGRECSDEWWAKQKSIGRPFLDHRRKYLYQIIREEIEKVGKVKLKAIPGKIWEYHEDTLQEKASYSVGFQDGVDAQLQKILALLEGKEGANG